MADRLNRRGPLGGDWRPERAVRDRGLGAGMMRSPAGANAGRRR